MKRITVMMKDRDEVQKELSRASFKLKQLLETTDEAHRTTNQISKINHLQERIDSYNRVLNDNADIIDNMIGDLYDAEWNDANKIQMKDRFVVAPLRKLAKVTLSPGVFKEMPKNKAICDALYKAYLNDAI